MTVPGTTEFFVRFAAAGVSQLADARTCPKNDLDRLAHAGSVHAGMPVLETGSSLPVPIFLTSKQSDSRALQCSICSDLNPGTAPHLAYSQSMDGIRPDLMRTLPVVMCPGCNRAMISGEPRKIMFSNDLVDVSYVCEQCGTNIRSHGKA